MNSASEPISLVIVTGRRGLGEKTMNPLLFFLLCLPLAFHPQLIQTFGRVAFYTILMALFMALVGIAVIVTLQERGRRSSNGLRIPERLLMPIANTRLTALGSPQDLEYLYRLPDVPFEPVIVERLFSGGMAGVFAIGTFVGLLGSFLAASVLNVRLNLGAMSMGIGLLWAWFFQRLRPTYYRITPGRMDEMQFSPITNRAWIVQRWDLKVCRITGDFKKGVIILTSPDEDESRIRLFGISEPRRFVVALFQAAVCTHVAPNLPEDRLLG